MNIKKLKNNVKSWKNKKVEILARVVLSLVLIFAFLLIFFLCGGVEYFNHKNIVSSCNESDMEVHFIDIGQGDATLIRFPNNKVMLIDTGEDFESDVLVSYLYDFFEINNISQLDYLVLTHQDADHVGGTSEVVENFNVQKVYRPKCLSKSEVEKYPDSAYKVSTTIIYDDAISSLYNSDIEMVFSESGIEFNEGGANVKFLSPIEDNYSNANNYSAVIKIDYDGKNFLFTGDCEVEAESQMLENFADELDVDVLKVSHHGSKTGTSEKFLQATTPLYACISVGEDNKYDLPDNEVLTALKNADCQVLMTSEEGSFAIAIDNGELGVFFIIMPAVDFTIVISCFGVALLMVWGIQIKKRNN